MPGGIGHASGARESLGQALRQRPRSSEGMQEGMNGEGNPTARLGDRGEGPGRPKTPGGPALASSTFRRKVVIRNPHGFHMRPAAAVAEAARRFQSQVTVIHGDRRSSAREILDLLMLLVEPGGEVILEASGPDACEAVNSLAAILEAEEPPPTPPLPKKG